MVIHTKHEIERCARSTTSNHFRSYKPSSSSATNPPNNSPRRPLRPSRKEKKIAFIEQYLPALPPWRTSPAIDEAVDEQSADSLKHMGAVIKAARARLEGKTIDGKALSDKVRDRLTPKS
jgi:hypothetical protein